MTGWSWPPLDALGEQERAAFWRCTSSHRHAPGEAVFLEGDPGHQLHVVVSGHLAVRVTTSAGHAATLNVLGPGDAFGELALLPGPHGGRRSASVVALDEVVTRVVARRDFEALRAEHPSVDAVLLAVLADRVRELSRRLLETMHAPLDRRLAGCLVDLVRVYGPGKDDGTRVVVPLTQEQLADMVGGARPTVSTLLQRLERQGAVVLGRGRVVLSDLAALRAAASAPG